MARHDPHQLFVETVALIDRGPHFERELDLIALLQAREADVRERRPRFHRAEAVVLMRRDRKSNF